MTAKDYLTALKVIREIQRKQAYCTGSSKPYLADTLKEIEMYCPLFPIRLSETPFVETYQAL